MTVSTVILGETATPEWANSVATDVNAHEGRLDGHDVDIAALKARIGAERATSGTITMPNGTTTVVAFGEVRTAENGVSYDNAGTWTISQAGIYTVYASLHVTTGFAAIGEHRLMITGSGKRGWITSSTHFSAMWSGYIAAAGTVKFEMVNNLGGGGTAFGSNGEMQIWKVAP